MNYGYICRGARHNPKNNQNESAYRFGQTLDIVSRIAAHEREGCTLIGISSCGEKFEPFMKERFRSILCPPRQRDNSSWLHCNDEITDFIIDLLEKKYIVPSIDFIDDLLCDSDIECWFFVGKDHTKPVTPILSRDGLTLLYESAEERLRRVRYEYKKDTDSFILTDAMAAAVQDVLGPDFGDAFAEAYSNTTRIHAKWFYTKQTDALATAHGWWPKTLVNPDTNERQAAFAKLKDQLVRGIVQQAIVYMKPDHLSTTYYQDTIMDFVVASFIPRGRIGLEHNYKYERSGKRRPPPIVDPRSEDFKPPPSGSATSGHLFLYIGPYPEKFLTAFAIRAGKGEAVLRKRS